MLGLHDASGATTAELDHGLSAQQVYEAEMARTQDGYGGYAGVIHAGLAGGPDDSPSPVPDPSFICWFAGSRRSHKFGSEDEKEQWMAKRRETHKEVERRRRDTINFGIGELAKIVPECDKNKGSIVHKAADYIKYLQRTNLVTIEKWRDEKKETDDKIKSLQEQVERLERELEAAKRGNGSAPLGNNDPKRRKTDA